MQNQTVKATNTLLETANTKRYRETIYSVPEKKPMKTSELLNLSKWKNAQ